MSFVTLVKDCRSVIEFNEQIMKIPYIKGIEAKT